MRPGWRAPSSRLGIRFSKFTAGSAVSTTVSQLVLTTTYGWIGVGATLATVLAFVAGAVPAFLINWHWTWGRRGRPALVREVMPYLMITIGGGFAATSLTAVAERLVVPLATGRVWQTVVVDAAYLASYGVLFVVKFALLDRTLTKRTRTIEPGPASPGQVNAAIAAS